MRRLIYLALTGVFCMGASQVLAHSFDVAIVTPSTGSTTAEILGGFRVATRERDGHPNEESDGHLGGLDVYMLPVDAEGEPGAVLSLAAVADIVLVIGADVLAQELLQAFGPLGPPVIGAGVLPNGGNWSEAAGAGSFLARYDAEFGRQATRAAALGYNAARRIELAVRPLEGVDDRHALAEALAASREGIEW